MLFSLFLACVIVTDDTGETTDTDKTTDTAPVPFSCGTLSCDARTQYCEYFVGGQADTNGEATTSYTCMAIPEACLPAPSCACLDSELDIPGGAESCREEGGALYVDIYGA